MDNGTIIHKSSTASPKLDKGSLMAAKGCMAGSQYMVIPALSAPW